MIKKTTIQKENLSKLLHRYNSLHTEVKRLADAYGYCHPMTERTIIIRDSVRAKLYQFEN